MTDQNPEKLAATSDQDATRPGTRLYIIHETAYHYGARVELAHHLGYLRPLSDATQQREFFTLNIEPEPLHRSSVVDVYDNTRELFSLYAPHDSLVVRAISQVNVFTRTLPKGMPDSPAWESVAASLCYVAGAPYVPEVDFSFASPFVPLHAELRTYAMQSFSPRRPLREAALDLMHRIHRDFRYESDSTQVSTPVLDAFNMKRGVCQDFAHVMIGCLRALGLSARYVSGYLLTQPPPGQERLLGADASHAWVQVWIPPLRKTNGARLPNGDTFAGIKAATEVADDHCGAWLDLDPTNDVIPTTSHVTLARGRDYGDVTPLRGVIRGGGRSTLMVAVSVLPVD